jgi:hypothetical protein
MAKRFVDELGQHGFMVSSLEHGSLKQTGALRASIPQITHQLA